MKKEYIQYAIYAGAFLAVITGLYFAYRAFMKVKGDAGVIADAVHDKAQDDSVAKAYNTDAFSVASARTIAKDIAVELETYKDMSGWDKATHVQLDTDTNEIMKRPKTEKELKLVSYFYKNQMTNNGSLYNDLKAVLSSKDLRAIKFIESINQ